MNINFGDTVRIFPKRGKKYIGIVVSRLNDTLTIFTPASEDRGFTYHTSFVQADQAQVIARATFEEAAQ